MICSICQEEKECLKCEDGQFICQDCFLKDNTMVVDSNIFIEKKEEPNIGFMIIETEEKLSKLCEDYSHSFDPADRKLLIYKCSKEIIEKYYPK
jgi:hypothetical protein